MVVLDTCVIVAALYSRLGASNALLVGALEGRFEFAISVALALEYEDVLLRDTTITRAWATQSDIGLVLDGLLSCATLVTPIHFQQRPLLRDADDEMVMECALQAGASAIVTLNTKDFEFPTAWPNIEVLQPGAMLARLKAKEMQK